MATAEEIMLTFFGKDEVSNVAKNIDKNVQSMGSRALTAGNDINSGLLQVSSGLDSMVSKLNGGKTAMDTIFGTSSKAETNSVLLKMMSSTSEAASKLNQHVDDVTNSSLVSMQSLIPAMNAFKTATGATDQQIYDATEAMAGFGAKVLAQTGSTELAETAMMDLSKGIKGACASLDQYGITVDALKSTGLWDGDENDIEGYMAAVQQLTGDTKELMETNEGLDKQLEKQFSSAGKKLGNEFLPGIKDVKRALIDLNKDTGGGLFAGILGATAVVDTASTWGQTITNIANGVKSLQEGVDIVAGKSKSMKKSKQAMEGLGEVAGMIPAGVGAEAAAGATEATVASAGLSGLGASISSMLAPLLTIAAVVAIMIPVVVALAAEALIFIKALAEVFKALNFDKLDLSGDIDGLKQIGVAIWELCKAMAAVVATSWLTMVYQGISAIMLFNDPIKVAVDELKKTATLIKGFSEITIPENVPTNLQTLSTSLGAIAKAMWSLQSVGVSVLAGSVLTLNGILGTLSQNLGVAKRELSESAKQINSMSELDTIDEGVASKLEAVTSSLANVGKAMGALSDVNWDINMGNIVNLGGAFGTITSHLEDAKDEIIKAAPVINQFSSLPDIDQSAGEKLKKVSDAIKNVADSLKNLNGLSKSMGGDNGALGTILKKLQLGASIRAAKSALTDAAKQLQGLNDLPDIPDGIKTKLSKIGSTTATVINTLKPLTSIQNMNVNSASIASKVAQARYAISNSAIHLASLSGISTIPDDIPTKLSKVGSTAATLINTLKPLTSIANSEVNAGAINAKVAQARYAISNAATHIASLAGISTIPENIGETLNRVSTSARQVATAATNLNTIPVVTATSANIMLAVIAIKTAIMQLNSLAGTTLNGGIGALLTSVTNALNQLKTTLYAMSSGFYSAGANIGLSIVNGVNTGLAPLSGITIARVASATNSAVGTGRSGGAKIGRAVTQGFKQNLKMAQAMKQEMSYVTQAVNNGISAAKTAARNGAQDVVAEFKRGIETGSPGAMAWATYDEMNYINDFIVSEGKNVVASAKRLGQNIVTGFGNPSLNVGLGSVPTNYNLEQLHGMRTLTSTAQWGKSIQNVELHIHEGAVQLDARNLTTRESKQIMINALEGLDAVTNINIKGIGA